MPVDNAKKDKRVEKVLITTQQLQHKCQEAANWINTNYANTNPIIVALLKDGVPFFGEVTKNVLVSCETDFVQVVESDDKNCGKVAKIIMDVHSPLLQRDVILLVALVDTGVTVGKLVNHFRKLSARSVRVLALVRRRGAVNPVARPTLSMFEIDREQIAGFGIDHEGLMRNLPYIGSLRTGA